MPLGLRLVRGMEILSETQSRIIGQAERQYMQRLRGMAGVLAQRTSETSVFSL